MYDSSKSIFHVDLTMCTIVHELRYDQNRLNKHCLYQTNKIIISIKLFVTLGHLWIVLSLGNFTVPNEFISLTLQ
jgi:hypothetical protein